MYANLEANVPKFETRKAMVIINMQNDTFEKREDLVVCEPQDFRDCIQNIVPYFRRIGDVVWIKTEFDSSAKPSSTSANHHHHHHHHQPLIDDNNEERTANLRIDDDEDDFLARQIDADTIGGYYPSSRAKAAMRKASAKARADFRHDELDAFVSDDESDAYLKKPRKGKSATVYSPGTRGAEFTPDTLANVDEANDLIVVKNHYSAFDATPLLVSLRMKLVTHIYLAGSLSNISIYATAADAVRHGFDVTVVEDCLGYRSEARHVDAMKKMADMLGVSGIDSEEIIEESGGHIPPDADPAIFSGPGLEGIRSRADLSDPVSKTIREHLRRSAVGMSHQAEPGSSTQLDRRRSPDASSSPPDTTTTTATIEGVDKSSTPSSVLGPGDHIGEGDSSILLSALSGSLADNAFKLVRDEVDWQMMRHRGGEVPRRVAVQGEIGPHGAVPLYRHPADESPPFLDFTPTVRKIRDQLQILLKQPFNHCLIQLYRNGQDNISEHADKTLDIVRGSNIINLSLGAQRNMTLRTKKLMHPKREDGEHAPRNSQRIRMPNNSVFVLGWRTNAKWLHGVRPDRRPQADKSEEERAYSGQRISLTFRHIGTYTNKSRTKIWGQGAKSKFQATAGDVTTSNSAQMEAMLAAFGKENHQVDFDWDAEYGEGFDALNLVITKAPNTTTLFLCGDELSNLRVKMAILERAIPCRMTRNKPTDTSGRRSPVVRRTIFSLSGDENPLFRDCDANQSESVGDLAILFYISRFYPAEPDPSVSAREIHRVASNVFARITQANELLFLWQELRGMPFNSSTRATHQVRRLSSEPAASRSETLADGTKHAEAFEGEMEVWEEYAEEAGYISGEVFTIVDCGFWPVLNEVVRCWEGWSERRYPNLANYWRKVGAMPTTRQAVIEKGDDK